MDILETFLEKNRNFDQQDILLSGDFLSTHGWINPRGPVIRWVDKPKSFFFNCPFLFSILEGHSDQN